MSQTIFARGAYLMRSHSETRWADMMDALNIDWLYEPRLVKTRHGAYLPDFYLPRAGLFVEVKGPHPTEVEREKAMDASAATGCPVVIAYGDMQFMFPGVGGARLLVLYAGRTVEFSTHELHGLIEHGLGKDAYHGYLRVGMKQPHPGALHIYEIAQGSAVAAMDRSVRERYLAGVSREANAQKAAAHRQISRCEWALTKLVEKLNARKEAA